uniref:NADH dehydrogenase [ubiquinone] 1 alpha subcomplex subunit 12 n=1 Tax=Homo sapiens TaxID=9606 RepID=A0A804HHX9_HUMAN
MELVQVLKRGLQQITGHGGLRGYLRVFFRTNDAKVGTLVGEDKYGNKYYEDNKQFFGRHRWVVYTTEMNGKNTFWDVDGSMVPPEWFFLLLLVDQSGSLNLSTLGGRGGQITGGQEFETSLDNMASLASQYD